MQREFDWPEPPSAPDRGESQRDGTPPSRERETAPDCDRRDEESRPAAAASRERESFELGGYRYQISPSEMDAVREIGRFRIIPTDDLACYQYKGLRTEMREDLDSLRSQGLIQERTVCVNGKGERLRLAALTRVGKQMLQEFGQVNPDQQAYAGFVKPAEVAHDAAIYRMYQAEARRIENAGGVIRRVILDYELKQNVYRPLAKIRLKSSPSEYAKRQAEIAAQNRLKVVQGKILLPDLRIEYQTRDGGGAHVDLELATHHYRGSQMRGKAQAGFKLYAPRSCSDRLSSAFDPELTAEIFSF